MRFAVDGEQRQFADALHELLESAGTPAVVRAWAEDDTRPGRALWRQLAEMGVAGLAVPEKWGGLQAQFSDVVVAMEELGRHAVPGPAIESAVAVPVLLSALGDDELCERWLPQLASGESVATLSLAPLVPYALDAGDADLTLHVSAGMLRLVDVSGLPVQTSVDPARKMSDLTDARGTVLATGPAVTEATAAAYDAGALACAAQLVGAGRMLLDMATAYAKQRVQFGRPIGEFQAVKHQLADVMVRLEFARPLLYGAAIALAEGSPTAARDVSAANVAAAAAADRAARASLQVHGAIGYTQEYDLGLWLTKVRALIAAWGTPSEHRARVFRDLAGGLS